MGMGTLDVVAANLHTGDRQSPESLYSTLWHSTAHLHNLKLGLEKVPDIAPRFHGQHTTAPSNQNHTSKKDTQHRKCEQFEREYRN